MDKVATYQRALVLLFILGLSRHSHAEYMLLVARSHPTPGGDYPVLRFTFDGTGPLTAIPEIPSTLLDDPTYFAFDTNGELFVANRHLNSVHGQGSISRFTFDGCEDFTAGERITGNELEWVHGLAMSPWGELFAANYVNRKISRFTFSDGGLAVPHGTIETERNNNLCLVFTPNGDLLSSHGVQGLQRFVFDSATGAVVSRHTIEVPGDSHGLAFDSHGELFIADRNGGVNRVIFDVAGNPISNGTIAVSNGPVGVAFSPADELFVTSHFDGGITRFVFDDAGNAIPNGFVEIDQLTGVAVTTCCPLPPPHETWSFIHIADPQLGYPSLEYVVPGGPFGLGSRAWFSATVYRINNCTTVPAFILVSGDIADYAWLRGVEDIPASWNYADFLDALASLRPEIGDNVWIVPGNHDGYLYLECDFSALPDLKDVLEGYKGHIDESLFDFRAYRPEGASDLGEGIYTFMRENLLFIGLDTGESGIMLDQIDHLYDLDLERCIPKIVFMHEPPVEKDKTVSDVNANFVTYCMTNNVQLVLAGHTHKNFILDEERRDVLPNSDTYPQFIQTSSAGNAWWWWGDNPIINYDPPGFQIIKVIDSQAYPQTPTETIFPDCIIARLYPQASLHVYDTISGNHVGMTDTGSVERNIPNSFYFRHPPAEVIIFDPSSLYVYEIVGTDEGTYKLDITSKTAGDEILFEATDISISREEIHRYWVNWSALSAGEEGVTLQIDANGDGVFERTVIADEDLTADEFALQTKTIIDFDPNLFNVRQPAKYVSVYIELPQDFVLDKIFHSTLRLNNSIAPVEWYRRFGDYDRDKIPDYGVMFDRQKIVDLVGLGNDWIVCVTGRLDDGRLFGGIDTIKITDDKPGKPKATQTESAVPQEAEMTTTENILTDSDQGSTDTHDAFDEQEIIAFVLLEACQAIGELGPENFDSEKSAIELTTTTDAMFAMLDDGLYAEAMVVLDNDILRRIDGCANTGQPDEDDWITSVEGQILLYPLVMEIIESLESLIEE